MRKMVLSFALLLLAAGFASPPAEAGLNVGASLTDTTVEQGDYKDDDNKYKVFVGYRFFERQWLGIEGQWVEYGDFSDGSDRASATSLDIFALLSLKVWRFDFFGKAGFTRWDARISGLPDEDGTDPAYGIGVAFRILTRLHVRAEYERSEFASADVDTASLGVDFRF